MAKINSRHEVSVSKRQHRYRSLLASASGGVLLLASLGGVAQAQDATSGGEQLEEIIVTGFRGSIEASVRDKREANAFVDVINAEDIGKFPDKNVADSLQRVPGIVISRDGGEGKRVSIRGLQSDLTLTQLNGNYVASADSEDPSRSFNYVLLPSNMISKVEVFKSPEARIDEGGVGGTVLLHTRRPLELPEGSNFLSVEGTYGDTTKKADPQVSGMLSWKDASETYGVLLGATWQRRTTRTMEASTESWRWWTDDRKVQPATDVNKQKYANDQAISYWWGGGTKDQSGNRYSGYWTPQSVNAGIKEERRDRLGVQATGQWRPTDDLTLTANYFRFELEGNYTQNLLKIPEWGYDNFFTGAKLDPSKTIFQGATFQVPSGSGCSLSAPPCTMETPQLSGIYSEEKSVSNTFDFDIDYNTDKFDASVKVGKTRATGGPSMLFRMSAKPRLTAANSGTNGNMLSAWDFSSGDLNMNFSPEIQANLMKGIAQIDTGSTDSSWVNSTLEQTYFQSDFTRRFDDMVLESVQFGAKYRTAKVHRLTGNTLWYADKAKQLRYQDTAAGGIADPSFFYSQAMGNITGGFNANIFPGINFDNYLSYLNKTYGEPVRREETDFVYDVNEDIWSGYVQGNFSWNRLRGNVGLRVAQTKQRGQSSDRFTYFNDYYLDGPNGPKGAPAICPNTGRNDCTPGLPITLPQDQRETKVNVLASQDKTYTDFLPSLNAAYEVTDDIILRGAVSKVIARPGYSDLGSQQRLEYRSAAYAADRQQFGEREGWTGSGGNKELKPFEAWQYDAGVEWYYSKGSVVGIGLFRKDVANFIVPLVIDTTRVIDGKSVTVEGYSTNANGSDATSQGIELYAQHTFDIGVGFLANFTYNDTSVTDVTLEGKKVGSSPLVGSAKTQINTSIFYENDLYSVRASYNRRGTVVGGIVSGLNVYQEPYDQIDLNATFNLTDDITVTASVINLTKSEQKAHLGNDTKARFYSNSYAGRRAYLGTTWKF